MTTRLKFHLMFCEDVAAYLNNDRRPYWRRLQAALTIADWLNYDPQQFTSEQLTRFGNVGLWITASQNPAGWLHKTAQRIIRLASDELEGRESLDDEYDNWLDTVATWRYDYHEDDYQLARERV